MLAGSIHWLGILSQEPCRRSATKASWHTSLSDAALFRLDDRCNGYTRELSWVGDCRLQPAVTAMTPEAWTEEILDSNSVGKRRSSNVANLMNATADSIVATVPMNVRSQGVFCDGQGGN